MTSRQPIVRSQESYSGWSVSGLLRVVTLIGVTSVFLIGCTPMPSRTVGPRGEVFVRTDELKLWLTFSVRYPSHNWLEEQAKAGTLPLDHAWITSWDGGSRFVLTASTEDLQDFLQKHASTPGTFGSFGTFYRRKGSR